MAKQKELVKKTSIEVSVDLDGLDEKHNWPDLAVYFFNKSGRLVDKQPLTKDSKTLSKGKALLSIPEKKDTLLAKIGPNVEDIAELRSDQLHSIKLTDDLKKPILIDSIIWRCWIKKAYNVTGTVKKNEGDYKTALCHGEVDIYEIDRQCILWLDLRVIERIHRSIIDIIIDPPKAELPDLHIWPSWDDDDWCGTKPRPPFPPRFDIRKKLEELPEEWSFALKRFDANTTAIKRIDTQLAKMDLGAKQMFLKSEALEGISISQILYADTKEFQKLLAEKFHLFRFWLCWYPWIYWIWWPYCHYSMKKIGTAQIQPDGSFFETVWISVCNHDVPDLWFSIRQDIGGHEKTIYRPYPIPCYTYWNHPSNQHVHLVVTDPDAISCYQEPYDNDGLWIVPLAIGNYSLKQIYGTGAGTIPTSNSDSKTGLYECINYKIDNDSDDSIDGNSIDFCNGPFGGTIGLRYLFSPELEDAHVKYYRIKYRSNGAEAWKALFNRVVRHYTQYDPVTHKLTFPAYELGPQIVGTEESLFEIPPNRSDWVVLNATVDLMNGYLDTTKIPNGFVDFKIELFNNDGIRIDPNSLGIPFLLPANNDIMSTITTTAASAVNPDLVVNDPENSAYQTFMFRLVVDNSKPTASIEEPIINPSLDKECGMIQYSSKKSTVTMPFTAKHPKGYAIYKFSFTPNPQHISSKTNYANIYDLLTPSLTVANLLTSDCVNGGAFSENLYIWNMAFNGWSRVGPDASATRAFALIPSS